MWYIKRQSISCSLEFETSHTTESQPQREETPKSAIQRWKCSFHEEKGHRIKNYRALKTFLDQLIQAGDLKEYVDQEKTKAEKIKVRSNPKFDRGNDEDDNALEEDIPLGIIHMIHGPNHPDLENKIRGKIRIF